MQRASKRKPGPRPPCADTACEELEEDIPADPLMPTGDDVLSSFGTQEEVEPLSTRDRPKKRKPHPTRGQRSFTSSLVAVLSPKYGNYNFDF